MYQFQKQLPGAGVHVKFYSSESDVVDLSFLRRFHDFFTANSFLQLFIAFTQGYDYTACGNSTSKKDSQANAAKDFINYLLRQGVMLPNEVPQDVGVDQSNSGANSAPSGGLGLSQRPVFQAG